jgi:hypothetical protein
VALRKYLIGRGKTCDIVLMDPTRMVSPIHAMLTTEDDVSFELIDLSTNGVRIVRPEGPIPIKRERVGLDDKVQLGTVESTIGDLLARVGVHPQVFISYSRQDRDRSLVIARYLSGRGLRIWWDDQLQIARAYDEQLERQIETAGAVLALWSEHSVKSQWVRAEASVALDRGVLLPVFIDRVDPPLLFRQIQGHFITGWDTDRLQAELSELADKIDDFLRVDRASGGS